MIRIKMFAKPKKAGSGGSGGGSITNNTTIVNNAANEWFEFDADYQAVRCKFDFYSVGSVSANRTSALTESLGLTPSQIAALQQLLSDPDTATKLQAIADKTTLTNTGTATAVSIDAQVAQQANP